MSTQPQLWRLSKLAAIKAPPDPDEPMAFEVPEFQRSLVWPTKKRQQLIDSIVSGYPIGALLLSERDKKKVVTADGSEVLAPTYAIVDGLQRSNTIADHLLNPFAEATQSILPPDPVARVAASLVESFPKHPFTEEQLSDAIVEWLHTVRYVDRETFEWTQLIASVCAQLGLPETTKTQDQALRPAVTALLAVLETNVDIGKYEIPVLIYSGPDRNLPDIFERINTQGTILSKYEIFAAAWVGKRVKLDDEDIREAINGRYAKLEAEGYTVDRAKAAEDVSLFEYLFGLSQVLAAKFPRLFSASAADASRSSAAFPVAALLLGLRLEDMDQIPKRLGKDSKGRFKVQRLTEMLLKAASVVDTALAPFLALKLTKESSATAHSELQMASMIGAAAAHGYDRTKDFARRPGAAGKEKALGLSLPQHYLLDIMRQTWRGPLYTYAYERVWDHAEKPSTHYTTPFSRETWNGAMAVWTAEQMSEVATKRPNVSAADKVILKFLYSKKVSVHDQEKNEYDVEHLVPVDRVLGMTVRAGIRGWPMGALGNICLLEKSVNRKKQTDTIAEYFNGSKAPSSEDQKEIAAMLFCSVADTSIPQLRRKDAMTEDEFRSFVRKRWQKMQTQLATNLKIAK